MGNITFQIDINPCNRRRRGEPSKADLSNLKEENKEMQVKDVSRNSFHVTFESLKYNLFKFLVHIACK